MRKSILGQFTVLVLLFAGCGGGGGGTGGTAQSTGAFPTASLPAPNTQPNPVSPSPTIPTPSPSVPPPGPGTPPAQPGAFPLDFYFQTLEGLGPQAMASTRYVVFHTDKQLLPADQNSEVDVYLEDLRLDTLTLVSRNTKGKSGDGPSRNAAISANGRFVVFSSDATDLVSNDVEGQRDIFLFDVHSSRVERLTTSANGPSDTPTISGDGSLVSFVSRSTNLVGSPSGNRFQLYLVNRGDATITLVTDSGSGAADRDALMPALSADGEKLVFSSAASNLGTPANAFSQILAYDVDSPSLSLISSNSSGAPANGDCLGPDIDGSGQSVVFFSNATDLSGGSVRWQVYRDDDGTTELLSRTTSQNPGNGDSGLCTISEDGSAVSFATLSTDLVGGAATQGSHVILSESTGLTLAGAGDTSALASDATQFSIRTNEALSVSDTDGAADVYAYLRSESRAKLVTAEREQTDREFISARGFLSGMRILKVADVDSDGHDDIVGYYDPFNYIEVYFGDGTGRFSSPVTVGVGDGPSGLAIGNIDNSGGADIVVSNDDDDTVSVIFFQTDRTFTTDTISVGASPKDVVLGHFNDDLNLDFAASCFFGFSFRYGDGAGNFGGAQDNVGFRSDGETDIGDFNEDGIDDVVGRDGFGVIFLLSDGPASFVESPFYPTGSQASLPIAADIDRDENLDVVTTAAIFFGDGTGNFTTDNSAPITYNYNLVDANLDTFLDVVTSTNGAGALPDGLGLRLNDGDANFTLTQEVDLALGGQPVAGDFNEDGFPDLARKSGDYIAIVSGDGTGFLDCQRLPVGGFPTGIAIVDLDGDNLLDVLQTFASNNSNVKTAYLFLGLNDGTLGTPFPFDFEGLSPVPVDLNGDGLLDLVSELMSSLNLGGGTFAAPTVFGVGNQPRDADIVHANNDLFFDLAIGSYASDDVTLLLGDGTQAFVQDSTESGFRINQVHGAFLNDDELEDLVTGDFNGVHVFMNSSAGYVPSQDFNLGGNLVQGVGTGDLDEDGDVDIVATTRSSTRAGFYTVFLNDGTGQFTAGTTVSLVTEVGRIEVVDIDWDGHLDIVIAGEFDNSVTLLYGDGTGQFQRGLDLVTDRNVTPFGLHVGDVNGDLKPDIVTGNGNESSIGVFLQR